MNHRTLHDAPCEHEKQPDDINLNIVTEGSAAGPSGIAADTALLGFAEAVPSHDGAATATARAAIVAELGDAALADAVAVVAAFNGIDRVADATGIPLDESMDERTEDLRTELGLNPFAAIA